MLKKIVILSLLIIGTAQPVILKNGADVSYDMVVRVGKVLKQLNIPQLCWLYKAANSDLIIRPEQRDMPCLRLQQGNAYGHPVFGLDEKWTATAEIQKLHSLGWCDQEGKLDKNTAHIIQSSIRRMRYDDIKFHYPTGVSMQNPIHIKNYFMPSFWAEKNQK
jgi:hypothetical protein